MEQPSEGKATLENSVERLPRAVRIAFESPMKVHLRCDNRAILRVCLRRSVRSRYFCNL